MVAELIDKHIWLIQTFINAGERGLTLQELSRKWSHRYNEDYPRRSFNNHREAVEDIFGIEIECNRSTNRYFIAYGDDVTDQDSSRQWLINTFTVNNLLNLSKERLGGRVSVEDIPSGQIHLTSIIEAMDTGTSLAIDYNKYTEDKGESLHVDPYGIKEFQKRWYLVGFCHERNAIRVYGLDRISHLAQTEDRFSIDNDFDIESLFRDSYGIYINEGQKAEEIVFRTNETQARFLRDLPLHPSQKEISRQDGSVSFSIRLIPNEALIMEFCRLAGKVEVLSPESLRKRLMEEFSKALDYYRVF